MGLTEGVSGRAFSGLQPVIVNDYANWPEAMPNLVSLGVRAVLVAPLVVNGRGIGSLAVHTTEKHDFSGRDAEVTMMLAAQLAPAIEAARAHEDLARREARQALVADIGRSVVLGLGSKGLVTMAVPALAELLGADSAAVVTEAGDGLRVAVGHGWLEGFTSTIGPSSALGIPGTALPPEIFQAAPGWPAGARCTAVNLEHEGNPAAIVLSRRGDQKFGASDLHYLGSIAIILTEASRASAAERALRASEEHYELLFESALEGVWHLDREGRTVYANRRMAEILHCDVPTLRLRALWDFTSEGDLPELQRRFAATLLSASGQFERTYRAADGVTVAVSVASSPIQDKNGEVTGVVVLVTDLTDRRAAEQAVRESDEKSRFLAGMSHELRTPMNSILGFSQLLEDPSFGPLNDRQRRYLGHIHSQGLHLLELINDVLDLSKVSAGRLEMARESVDLATVASDVVSRMRPLAEAKAQELRLEVATGAVVCADRLRVAQSLFNLVSNAVKFSPEGGHVLITVARAGDGCTISVADDGPGIALEDQATVFDEFSKLSSGRRGQGTGLGLSLTRRLVQAMGGKLTLSSEVGRGSDFRIALPAA